MKKYNFILILFLLLFISSESNTNTRTAFNPIEQIRISKQDIPEGFTFGKIPRFARKVLKGNPWMMDRAAIKKLTNRIYPGGDYNKVKKIHMTIMASRKNLFGDDIVCYIIVFKNNRETIKEIKKIEAFADFNRDRVILLSRKNVAVYLHVDEVGNLHHIRNLAARMKEKLQRI